MGLKQDGQTHYVMRPVEGSLLMTDKINQAYTREIFRNSTVMSGLQFMPFEAGLSKEVEKSINCIGDFLYPVLTTMALPTFLYNLVLEKEQRLLQNMKINGMRMSNYWIVTFIFNFILYVVYMSFYYGFGKYVSGLTFFTETNETIMVLTLIGWGLCQISMSFLLSSFIDSSQTASMVGYAVSIMACVACSTVLATGTEHDCYYVNEH